jgi:hypothetical protein
MRNAVSDTLPGRSPADAAPRQGTAPPEWKGSSGAAGKPRNSAGYAAYQPRGRPASPSCQRVRKHLVSRSPPGLPSPTQPPPRPLPASPPSRLSAAFPPPPELSHAVPDASGWLGDCRLPAVEWLHAIGPGITPCPGRGNWLERTPAGADGPPSSWGSARTHPHIHRAPRDFRRSFRCRAGRRRSGPGPAPRFPAGGNPAGRGADARPLAEYTPA